MNWPLAITFGIVFLGMGVWVIWDLIRGSESFEADRIEGFGSLRGGIFVDQNKDIWVLESPGGWRKLSSKILEYQDDEEWEHYYHNYY